MWPRVVEMMIGFWLCMSPFVFRHTEAIERFVAMDLIAGSTVVVLSLLSFWSPTANAHFLTAGLALAMGTLAYAGWERPGPPGAQNELMVACLLVLFGIIPNNCNQPPDSWRRDKPAHDSGSRPGPATAYTKLR
jgi:hypothetical protein